jgi:SNF2 family DNA or RNA helicase
VAKELPEMISVEIQCELTMLQDQLYDMAENGVSTDDEENAADTLSSLTMCAQAVNAPQLILDEDGNPFEGPSSKVDALIDLLTGDAEDQKVIVFSRFEKMVSLIGKVLESHKIKYVRVTGKESDPKLRRQNCETFQDSNSGVNVILITMAGSESLNLQAAEHFVFVDLPWSYGDMLQLVGRMIRIGSSHKTVVAHYMLGLRQSGEKTIDHHVLKALKEKMKLADKVAGKSMVNALQFTKSEDVDMIREIAKSMSGGEKNTRKSSSKDVKIKSTAKAKPEAKKKAMEEPSIESISLDFSDL